MALKPQLRTPIAALLIIFVLALDGMWGLIHRNGYYEFLRNVRDNGPRVLPGSDNPIRAKYTGIALLDYWMAVMNTVLANVTDGSAIYLSLYAFQFAGQLGSITTILMIEEIYQGHTPNPLKWFSLWGLAMTAFGYAVIMPVYAIVHLLISSTAKSKSPGWLTADTSESVDYQQMSYLPVSVILGYVVPSLLMVLPTVKNEHHQFFVGMWHLFPLWVSLAQRMLHTVRHMTVIEQTTKYQTQDIKKDGPDLVLWGRDSLRRAYRFASIFSVTTHVSTILFILWANKLHSAWVKELSISAVFMPLPRTYKEMESFAKGTLDLLQYDQYIGSLAALIWAISVDQIVSTDTRTKFEWFQFGAKITLTSVFLGPATAVVAMRWKTQKLS